LPPMLNNNSLNSKHQSSD